MSDSRRHGAGGAGDGGPGPKPAWLKKPLPGRGPCAQMETLLRDRHLHTVCESAKCPNKGECFERGTATFLIMGGTCTRDCRFCSVEPRPARSAGPGGTGPRRRRGCPHGPAARGDHLGDPRRPARRRERGTSWPPSGRCAERLPQATVEVLVPDFGGDLEAARHGAGRLAGGVQPQRGDGAAALSAACDRRPCTNVRLRVLQLRGGAGQSIVKTGLHGRPGGDGGRGRRGSWKTPGRRASTWSPLGSTCARRSEHLPVVEYVRPEVFAAYAAYGERAGACGGGGALRAQLVQGGGGSPPSHSQEKWESKGGQ